MESTSTQSYHCPMVFFLVNYEIKIGFNMTMINCFTKRHEWRERKKAKKNVRKKIITCWNNMNEWMKFMNQQQNIWHKSHYSLSIQMGLHVNVCVCVRARMCLYEWQTKSFLLCICDQLVWCDQRKMGTNRITCNEHWWIRCWLMTIKEFNGSHLKKNNKKTGVPFSFWYFH